MPSSQISEPSSDKPVVVDKGVVKMAAPAFEEAFGSKGILEAEERIGAFVSRHIGPRGENLAEMLKRVGVSSLEELVAKTVPESIRLDRDLNIPDGMSESELLEHLRELAEQNEVFRSFIGLGYYETITPPVILRNILENPAWYTSYTPYQAEISQGRLEALLNYQTMVCDLTGMELANSSLLDEATAAAEAMTLSLAACKKRDALTFVIDAKVHPQTLDTVKTRAIPLGLNVVVTDDCLGSIDESVFGVLVQYPDTFGEIRDYKAVVDAAHDSGALISFASDLLALSLLVPPGELGADIVLGNSQRFGVPMGFGGPHAAFFATKEAFKRHLPGRLVGVSKDSSGKPALRLALQTREQHIKRERATSNICTAQVLLAVMAGMYGVYHGPKGIKQIANRVHKAAKLFARAISARGLTLGSSQFFDTVRVSCEGDERAQIIARAEAARVNLRTTEEASLFVSFDEKITTSELCQLVEIFTAKPCGQEELEKFTDITEFDLADEVSRTSEFMSHEVFNKYHSETELLRYLHQLSGKDISLTNSMIPLGSCTMKLNAAAEMIPITFRGFAQLHPFAPSEQTAGYQKLISNLEAMLCEITGFEGVSLQPNSGAQGEYAGLLTIRDYHLSRGDTDRNVCLIPTSAHGTNPASAIMAGMKVIPVKCDEDGNIDVEDLRTKARENAEHLSALMITYPSTHGVFEESVREVCKLIHDFGGQVYMDGANMNAQVGLCQPGQIGADVCHLNLHKTFCIPHGGGGPGVGPIGVAKHLVPFLPGHAVVQPHVGRKSGAISAAPWGSAAILPISYAYICMMGGAGLKRATEIAILNANYIAKTLEGHYDVLYKGSAGFVAHECILDLRNFKRTIGIEVGDVAKRLMDFGFHAPTVSWPVIETLMVEPTESESKAELDRFCEAMIAIRDEMRKVENGELDAADSPLKFAPHTALDVSRSDWNRKYQREEGAYPAEWLRENKYWPPVGRIDNAFGDRNLFCACVPAEGFDE